MCNLFVRSDLLDGTLMMQIKINSIFKLSIAIASCLLVNGCYVPPSDETLIERFQENSALLDELQRQHCSLADDPRMRFISIYALESADDRIIGWEDYQEDFRINPENQKTLESLHDKMENLNAKSLFVSRVTSDVEHVSNHLCHIQVSVWQLGFVNNHIRTGFEYNPPNENLIEDFESLPERKSSDDVLYRYKLRDDDEDFWYLFYDKT